MKRLLSLLLLAVSLYGLYNFNAQRAELARKMLKRAHASERMDAKLVFLWESYAYSADAAVKAEIESLTPVYIRRLESFGSDLTDEASKELTNMEHFLNMGIRCGLFAEDCPLALAVKSARKECSK